MANKQHKSSLVRFFTEDLNDTRILDNGFGATVKRSFKLACGVKDNEDFAETAPRWRQAINPVNWLEFVIRLPADLLDRASLIGVDRDRTKGSLILDEENDIIPAKDVKLSPGRKVVRAVANLARLPHILTRPFTYPSQYFIADGTKESFTRADYIKAGTIIFTALVVAGLIAAIILTGGLGIPALAGVAAAASYLGTALAGITGLSAATGFLVATAALAAGAFITLAKIVPALVEELQGLASYLFTGSATVDAGANDRSGELPGLEGLEEVDGDRAEEADTNAVNPTAASAPVPGTDAVPAPAPTAAATASDANRDEPPAAPPRSIAAQQPAATEVPVAAPAPAVPAQVPVAAEKTADITQAVKVFQETLATEKTFCEKMERFSNFLITHQKAIEKLSKEPAVEVVPQTAEKKQKRNFLARVLFGKKGSAKKAASTENTAFAADSERIQLDIAKLTERYRAMAASPLLGLLSADELTASNLNEKLRELHNIYANPEFMHYLGKMVMLSLAYVEFSELLARYNNQSKQLSDADRVFLVSYAIEPIQRFMRYALLTQELVNSLKKANADEQSIQKAEQILELVKVMAAIGNKIKPESNTPMDPNLLTSRTLATKVVQEAPHLISADEFDNHKYEQLNEDTLVEKLDTSMHLLQLDKEIQTDLRASVILRPAMLAQVQPAAAPSAADAASTPVVLPTTNIAANLAQSMLTGPLNPTKAPEPQLSATQADTSAAQAAVPAQVEKTLGNPLAGAGVFKPEDLNTNQPTVPANEEKKDKSFFDRLLRR